MKYAQSVEIKFSKKCFIIFLENLVQQFKRSPIGMVIHDQIFNRLHTKMLDPYLIDFIYMTHPCADKIEHQVMMITVSICVVESCIKTVIVFAGALAWLC